jgi:hypothetical protein
MSLETGAQATVDWVVTSENAADSYRNIILEIPFYKTTKPYLVSWMAGLQYGGKAGSGVLFVDARFAMDIGKSRVGAVLDDNTPSYQRYLIYLGLVSNSVFSRRR